MDPTQNPLGNVQIPPAFGGVPGVPPQFTAKWKWSFYRFTNNGSGVVPLGDYKVFQTTQGTNGQGYTSAVAPSGLTWRETSQSSDTAKVPLQVNWICHGVSVGFKETDNLADVQQLLDACVVCIEQNDNPVPLGPAALYPWGGGAYGVADAGSTGTGASFQNGFMQNIATRPQGERPFILQAGTQFSFILRLNRASQTAIALAEGAVIEMGVGLWVWEDKAITQGG